MRTRSARAGPRAGLHAPSSGPRGGTAGPRARAGAAQRRRIRSRDRRRGGGAAPAGMGRCGGARDRPQPHRALPPQRRGRRSGGRPRGPGRGADRHADAARPARSEHRLAQALYFGEQFGPAAELLRLGALAHRPAHGRRARAPARLVGDGARSRRVVAAQRPPGSRRTAASPSAWKRSCDADPGQSASRATGWRLRPAVPAISIARGTRPLPRGFAPA